MNASVPVPSLSKGPEMNGSEPLIQLKGVWKSFGSLEVLKGIDLDIHKGEAVVLIGSSGSGKSTLLRCINLLEVPTRGSVLFSGIDLMANRRRLREIRGKLGMVFQSFNLYPHMTALGNVTLALRRVRGMSRADARQAGIEALAAVGLSDKIDNYPAQLSGGQKQRVGIARALALEPEAVLFDEPTSALDPELVGEVLDVMMKLRQTGMTMVVVTHEMRFARRIADRVVVMDDGQIVEQGPAEKLFSEPVHERTRQLIKGADH
jgi:ABC-type polar amino acid transport system ATPase subunit